MFIQVICPFVFTQIIHFPALKLSEFLHFWILTIYDIYDLQLFSPEL
jgi:hypothetical protein